VWSKVVAGIILAILAAIWAAVYFDWWSALVATWPVPRWLFGLLVLLILTLAVLLYRARQVTLQSVRGEVERCKVELQKSNREATRLEEELKAEKASLQDCPQVFIELNEYDTQKAVAVHNVSQTVDAFDIRMNPVDGQDVRLVAEYIHHLKAGETKRLELTTERKVRRAGLPNLPARSDVRVFLKKQPTETHFLLHA